MNPISIEDLYRAKAARRRQLAALPIEEKVRIMEKLRAMGRSMRAARQQARAATPPPAADRG